MPPSRSPSRWLFPLALAGTALFGGTVGTLVVAYREVQTEAIRAYQDAQLQSVHVLAANIGFRFEALDLAARSIDVEDMPPDNRDRNQWLRKEANRFGRWTRSARFVVRAKDGRVIADTQPGLGEDDHDHKPGVPCQECFQAGKLVFSSRSRNGETVQVSLEARQLSPLLVDSWAWMVSPDGSIGAHADPDLVGTRPFDASRDDPALTAMLGEMRRGEQGSARYTWVDPSTLEREERVASYAPVSYAPPGWSLAVSTEREDALEGVDTALRVLMFATLGVVGSMLVVGIGVILATRRDRLLQEEIAEERLSMTRAAAHSERLALLGTITAGVAHDLRNPLSGLNMGLQLAKAAPDEVDDKLVDQMLASVRAIDAIADDLTRFSRSSGDEWCRPADAVDKAVRMLGAKLMSGRELTSDVPELPRVPISEMRLSQVLMNLLMNAAHVARTIRITGSLSDDGNVELIVDDDGPGIATEIQDRLFEAFATTKKEGEGTGLGLYLARTFLREIGGDIEATDSPMGGARFRVTLPVAVDDDDAVSPN